MPRTASKGSGLFGLPSPGHSRQSSSPDAGKTLRFDEPALPEPSRAEPHQRLRSLPGPVVAVLEQAWTKRALSGLAYWTLPSRISLPSRLSLSTASLDSSPADGCPDRYLGELSQSERNALLDRTGLSPQQVRLVHAAPATDRAVHRLVAVSGPWGRSLVPRLPLIAIASVS